MFYFELTTKKIKKGEVSLTFELKTVDLESNNSKVQNPNKFSQKISVCNQKEA